MSYQKIGLFMIKMSVNYDRSSQAIWRLLSQVEAFRQAVQSLPVPPKLAEYVNRLVVARTVHGTVAIEGSSLTEEEAQDLIGKEGKVELPGREREKMEALAAQRAHEYVRTVWGKEPDRPITEEDVCHIHRLLTEGIPYENNLPGEYRHHAVRVGSPRHGGVYKPPEGRETIRRLVREFLEWLNSREVAEGEPGPVRAILAHYFFVLIHPFGDGNGRTARALESLILYKGGYNVKGFYSLANYYYRHRDDYFTHLQLTRTRHQGDQAELLLFALQGLVEELEYIQHLIIERLKIILFQNLIKERYDNKKLNSRQYAILDALSDMPAGIPWEAYRNKTIPLLQGLYQRRTTQTLVRDLRRMMAQGLAKVARTEKDQSVVKACVEIMDAFI